MSEVIYLYRRKGHPSWVTCDFWRYQELGVGTLFDTKTAYTKEAYSRLAAENERLRSGLEDMTRRVARLVIEGRELNELVLDLCEPFDNGEEAEYNRQAYDDHEAYYRECATAAQEQGQ